MRRNNPLSPEVVHAILKAAERPRAAYLARDPVHLARLYRAREDREVVALLGALLAFGRVAAFLPKIRGWLGLLGPSPRRYVLEFDSRSDRAFYRSFRSRVYTGDDLRLLLIHLRRILEEHGTLEAAFLGGAGEGMRELPGHEHLRGALLAFSGAFHALSPRRALGPGARATGYRHLVCDPALGGAAKRWNLFLRWVVRPDDGVDLGLWSGVRPAHLLIPLDTHLGRISLLLGLRRRKTLDWKAAEEVTASLRLIDPLDPVRFDFSLSHVGISGGCRGRWVAPVCRACSIASVCRIARGRVASDRLASGAIAQPGREGAPAEGARALEAAQRAGGAP